jgi:1-aminocyclopropane-1-carboxylate deaminase
MQASESYKVPSPVQAFQLEWMKERNLSITIKRDDLIHNVVSGNKWRKLKFNLLQVKHLGKTGVLTFGGAYSNHLLATAHVCHSHGLQSMAIVRGDELNEKSNDILRQCAEWGMKFRFVSREEYHLKDDFEYKNELKDEFRSHYIIPEGGKSYLGIIGCQEIVSELEGDFDEIWVAQGTCTTSIGLALSCNENQTIQAVPVLKRFDVSKEINDIMKFAGFDSESVDQVLSRMNVHSDYHFGGYGKKTEELSNFILKMKEEHHLDLDPIYAGKAFFALLNYYKNSNIENRKIVFLHTGGLIAGSYLK